MIAAIIQTRLGSSRLPGKVLMDISGRPLVWHVVNRCRAARRVDTVLVATTASPADEPLRAYLKKENIPFATGSETDVLGRYDEAAKACGASVVVRVCSDRPFQDPVIVDHAIDLFLKANPAVDYVANCSYDGSIPATYPEGLDVEVLSASCLALMAREAQRPSEREHVTPFLFNQGARFRKLGFRYKENLSKLRWTIDYPKDLEFTREVYRQLYTGKPIFLMDDILNLLQRHPELARINSGVPHHEGYLKSVKEEAGLGHL